MSIFKKSKGDNRWIKDRNGLEEDLLALSDEASCIYESSVDLIKGLQTFIKSVGEDEKKHPYGKASRACKAYVGGMRTPNNSFTKVGEQFDAHLAACHELKEHINSTVLAKMISFKDVECKECDQLMTMLKKAQNEYRKKKSSNDQVQAEVAETSLKKLIAEAKTTLAKFNGTGVEVLNQLAAEMKAGFSKYCETGSA